jgi:hypothetical protein
VTRTADEGTVSAAHVVTGVEAGQPVNQEKRYQLHLVKVEGEWLMLDGSE